jgi:hypothetical protein
MSPVSSTWFLVSSGMIVSLERDGPNGYGSKLARCLRLADQFVELRGSGEVKAQAPLTKVKISGFARPRRCSPATARGSRLEEVVGDPLPLCCVSALARERRAPSLDSVQRR